jgi:putative peptide zinc metalloprotease protein
MFTPGFVAASLVLFAIYFVVLGQGWDEFAQALKSTYSLHNITWASAATLWITGAAVILIHELGHAFTCKFFGGEVRELGFMLLYFQPAFYCNVSDAWSFPERRARLWVTAAGSWIQIFVASLAAILWSAVAPGTLAANVAVAAMLVGGLTTVLTNANPLLPLDGYFALADWLEIPNLRHRALGHFSWWIKSHVLRLEIPQPEASAQERRIFLTYGALSFLYVAAIFVVLAALALGWAGQALGALGVVLGVGVLLLSLRQKIVQLWRTVALSVRARRAEYSIMLRRRRTIVALAALGLALFLPWTLTSPGSVIVRPAASRTVTAPDSGVVVQVFVSEGMRVDAGAPLVRVVDRALESELLGAARTLDSLTISESAARANDRDGDAERLGAERASAFAQFTAIERRISALTVRATSAGVVASKRPEELMGRAVGGGDSLLTLAVLDSVELRVALRAGGATRVRPGQTIHVISYSDPSAPWTGRVADISAAGVGASGLGGVVEARVRRAAAAAWRPGMIGEASVELERSTVAGALWWKARQLLRTDLWL